MSQENLESYTFCDWQGQQIISELKVANTFFTRFRGLLGQKKLPVSQGLLISPCNSVHSVGMAFSLGVIFLSADFRVLRVFSEFKPYRLSPLVKHAKYVLEVNPELLKRYAIKTGDTLSFYA